jgi:hypothetical protein
MRKQRPKPPLQGDKVKLPKRQPVIDEHGFSTLSPGTELTFVMSASTLEHVNRAGEALGMNRREVLAATIVGKKFDPNFPKFFVELRALKSGDGRKGLRIFDTNGGKFVLTSTQNPKLHGGVNTSS